MKLMKSVVAIGVVLSLVSSIAAYADDDEDYDDENRTVEVDRFYALSGSASEILTTAYAFVPTEGSRCRIVVETTFYGYDAFNRPVSEPDVREEELSSETALVFWDRNFEPGDKSRQIVVVGSKVKDVIRCADEEIASFTTNLTISSEGCTSTNSTFSLRAPDIVALQEVQDDN